MQTLTFLTSAVLLLLSSNAQAGPINPLNCACDFEGVIPDGMGFVEATDCQITEETSYAIERGARGAFTETLSFVGGAGQACATMQVEKFRDGNDSGFRCAIWLQESNSNNQSDCSMILNGTGPIYRASFSRRGMRRCQRLLDDVAEAVDALPDCGGTP